MEKLLTPMFLHVALCSLLYGLLTLARAPSIWGIGKNTKGENPFDNVQPRISANLSNQFEWPVLFYVICLLLIASDSPIDVAYVTLAWLFIIGRVLHSMVQIGTSNVRLRGIIFMINFVAVLAMWGKLFVDNLVSPL